MAEGTLMHIPVAMRSVMALAAMMICCAAIGQTQVRLLTNRIELAPVARKLSLTDRRKFDSGIYQYRYRVPDTPGDSFGALEAHGYYESDLNMVIVACHRFFPNGGPKREENIGTPCGLVNAEVLSIFVDSSIDFANHLMRTAKLMGKQFSTSRVMIGDFVFEYCNDGSLTIRRASRTVP